MRFASPRLNHLVMVSGSALALAACEGFSFSDEAPVLLDVEQACFNDRYTARILLEDVNEVTNTTIMVGEARWYPTLDIDQGPGTVTAWDVEEDLGCDGPWELTLTATNLLGFDSSYTLYWPVLEPETEGVQPEVGPTSGGSIVTILGDEIDQASSVRFGGEPATILGTEDGALVVETPAHAAGAVDVEVEVTGNTATLASAYTYYPTQEGLYGGIVRPTVFVYDPLWFSIGSPYTTIEYGPYLQIDLLFNTPVPQSDTFLGASPPVGSCEWGSSSYEPISGGSYLMVDDTWVMQNNDSVYTLVLDQQDPEDWAGLIMDLEVPGSTQLPAQVLEDALVIPALLTDTSFDWQDINPRTWGEDLTLSWSSSNLSGIYYVAYAVQGYSTLGTLSCTEDPALEGLTVEWDALVEGVSDPSQVDGIMLLLELWEDVDTPFVHDASMLWSRGRIQYWIYFPLTMEKK